MAGSMGNKKYLSEKNKELPFLETLKNYLDRQDNINTLCCKKADELAQEVNYEV